MKHALAAAAAAAIITFNTATAHDGFSKYKLKEIPSVAALFPGCLMQYLSDVSPVRVNDKGVVVGTFHCYIANLEPVPPRPPLLNISAGSFTWSAARGPQILDAPVGSQSAHARDIDNSNRIIGWILNVPVEWSLSGGYAEIFYPPNGCTPTSAFPAAITENGAIAGNSYQLNPATGTCSPFMSVLKPNGVEVVGPAGTPYAMNESRVAVGFSAPPAGYRRGALKWRSRTGEVFDLEPPTPFAANIDSVAVAVNDKELAVGWVASFINTCSSRVTGKVWNKKNESRDLPPLPGDTSTRGYAIDDDNTVYGQSFAEGPSCTSIIPARATIWRGDKVRDLNTLVPHLSGIRLDRVYDVSDKGHLIVFGKVLAEPLASCPRAVIDPLTGVFAMDFSYMCAPTHAYLLTPQ